MILSKAIFSDCRKYRYMLTRQWDSSKRYIVFVGLNPSTADETLDDPTIRREIAFAKSWGFGGLIKVNLFAYRATDPVNMKCTEDSIGPDNTMWLKEIVKYSDTIVMCWGSQGTYMNRGDSVKKMFQANFSGMINLYHLGLTKNLQPKHPLYLKSTTELLPF
jgi:hypothetical protein